MAHLLDKNYAKSIFGFIFSYTQHKSYVEEEQSFENVIRSIFSVPLPEEILTRLQTIFNQVKKEQLYFEDVLSSFVIDFKEQSEILISTFQLLLKFSCEDGMLSQFDSKRLKNIFYRFQITEEHLLQFTEKERIVIETLVFANKNVSPASEESLFEMYQILECAPNAEVSEIKKNYYSLAKRFHPDTTKEKGNSKKYFQKIQNAYEAVLSSRKM